MGGFVALLSDVIHPASAGTKPLFAKNSTYDTKELCAVTASLLRIEVHW